MRPIRSLLFVPGHKSSWIDKIPSYGADAIVLDLEDSVPNDAKAKAREIVGQAIPRLHAAGQRLYVRSNRFTYSYDADDLRAVVQPGLAGIFVSKGEDPADVEMLSRIISDIELQKNMAVGTTRFIFPVETALAAQLIFEIASHPRVEHVAAVTARGADLERNLGFSWTPEGLETLYHRSQAVIAAKAAKKPFPIGGMAQDVHDLDAVRKAARFNKQLGFCGEIVLHPSNVPVVNEVFSPSKEEIEYYRGLIAAFQEGERKGHGAVMYRGQHIDIAHVVTARQLLEMWDNKAP